MHNFTTFKTSLMKWVSAPISKSGAGGQDCSVAPDSESGAGRNWLITMATHSPPSMHTPVHTSAILTQAPGPHLHPQMGQLSSNPKECCYLKQNQQLFLSSIKMMSIHWLQCQSLESITMAQGLHVHSTHQWSSQVAPPQLVNPPPSCHNSPDCQSWLTW